MDWVERMMEEAWPEPESPEPESPEPTEPSVYQGGRVCLLEELHRAWEEAVELGHQLAPLFHRLTEPEGAGDLTSVGFLDHTAQRAITIGGIRLEDQRGCLPEFYSKLSTPAGRQELFGPEKDAPAIKGLAYFTTHIWDDWITDGS